VQNASVQDLTLRRPGVLVLKYRVGAVEADTRMKEAKYLMERLMAQPGRKISLDDHDPSWSGRIDKQRAAERLQQGVRQLAKYQDRLYAQDTYALLVIFQAMDAAGKDGTIRHVMSGVNPQGVQVSSFKQPSPTELDHDYLWRYARKLPARGDIGIFNRSYYEEVLVVRVHAEILAAQQLPPESKRRGVWRRRFAEINNLERYLVDNGIVVLKFFLNVSKKEQKRRFLERIEEPDKNWKFSLADVHERQHWKDYMRAYEDAFTHTSTKYAPWYIIPADNKWFMRLAVAAIMRQTLQDLDLRYPTVSKEKKAELQQARNLLLSENN
jgi:PPK2 family polyphosphate:nucleotide phosphotransferase